MEVPSSQVPYFLNYMEHHFNVNLAVRFGIEKAVIINNLYFWINHNAKNNKHVYEGRVWTFNSVSAFYKLMPYIKQRTLYRYLNELEEAKVISIGNFNKSPFDKTKWYSFTDEFIKMLEVEGYDIEKIKAMEDTPTVLPENRQHGKPTTRKTELHKMANRELQSGETIPDNIPYNIPDKREKDIDKSISKSNYQQGCGTLLSPSVAPQPLSAASSGVSSPCSSDDAFAPLTFEEEEATNKGATACGVNVNSLQPPLPPFFPSDADAEPSGEVDAKPTSKSKARAKSKPADTTDYDAIVEFWNKTNPNLRQVRNLNNKRKKQIRKLISENDATIDDVFNAMRAISVSSFCNGSHNWRADFDWFIADTKSCFNRLLEGAFFSSPEERGEFARIATGTNANFEPKLPNGWDRERYDMYIRNGFEITEDGKLYKNGKLYK